MTTIKKQRGASGIHRKHQPPGNLSFLCLVYGGDCDKVNGHASGVIGQIGQYPLGAEELEEG